MWETCVSVWEYCVRVSANTQPSGIQEINLQTNKGQAIPILEHQHAHTNFRAWLLSGKARKKK